MTALFESIFKRRTGIAMQKQKLFVLGANRRAGADSLSYQERFEITGRNTGNLLIGNGLYRQLQYARWGGASVSNPPGYIKEKFDRIVLPSANYLNRHFDLSAWARFVESVDLPCLMVGLGAQAPDKKTVLTDIPKGTIRFIKAVAERSESIGVRGHYTAEVLKKLGINNIDVVGCPSFYTNLSKPPDVTKKRFKGIKEIVITGSSNVISHSYNPTLAGQVERKLFRMADTENFAYVLQSELPEILYLEKTDATRKLALKQSAKVLGYASVDAYAATICRTGKVFFDVQEWFNWMRKQEFVIGTRLHGAVAALLQGVPALIICHDTRTKEMCELMRFPHISLSDAEDLSLEDMYEQAAFRTMHDRYVHMCSRYVAFLEKNGVPHKF